MFCVTQIPETGETECKLVIVMWPNARTQAPRGRQTVGRKWLIRRGAAGGYSDGRWAGDVKYCLISNWQNLNRPMAFSLHHLIKQCKKVTEFVDIWTTGKGGGWRNMPIWHQFSWMPNWKVLRGGKKKWHHTTTQFPQMWVRRSTHTCTQQYDIKSAHEHRARAVWEVCGIVMVGKKTNNWGEKKKMNVTVKQVWQGSWKL